MREEMTAVWTRTRCLVFVFPLSLSLSFSCYVVGEMSKRPCTKKNGASRVGKVKNQVYVSVLIA